LDSVHMCSYVRNNCSLSKSGGEKEMSSIMIDEEHGKEDCHD